MEHFKEIKDRKKMQDQKLDQKKQKDLRETLRKQEFSSRRRLD